MSELAWLQMWLLENCCFDSDNYYKICIKTIDNPGWKVLIQVKDTYLENSSFEKMLVQRDDENDWFHCFVEGGEFRAFCGPKNLQEVICVFQKWAKES